MKLFLLSLWVGPALVAIASGYVEQNVTLSTIGFTLLAAAWWHGFVLIAIAKGSE